ncbi:MAG: MmgE/PrpD family protein, partial [Bosea sp. (in: a-proteobacteria)]
LALARLCRWEALEPNRFPQAFEAEIACHLRDGRVLSARIDDVFGNASRPAAQADVLAKFRANAGRALSPAAVGALEAFYLAPAEAGDFHAYAAALSDRLA